MSDHDNCVVCQSHCMCMAAPTQNVEGIYMVNGIAAPEPTIQIDARKFGARMYRQTVNIAGKTTLNVINAIDIERVWCPYAIANDEKQIVVNVPAGKSTKLMVYFVDETVGALSIDIKGKWAL